MKNGALFATARISSYVRSTVLLALQGLLVLPSGAQTHIPLQPFAQQVRQVETSLDYLGQPLNHADRQAIKQLIAESDEASAASRLEHILDRYTVVMVEINAESRVKVQQGPAKPELTEAGTRVFLVKVVNKAGVTAPLIVQSPNALPVFVQSDLAHHVLGAHAFSRILIVRTTCCVHMMVARVPLVFRRIDPTLHRE